MVSGTEFEEQGNVWVKYYWEITRNESGDLAVVPITDKREHKPFCEQCECEPTIEVIGSYLLYVHSAFDFREIAEELDRNDFE